MLCSRGTQFPKDEDDEVVDKEGSEDVKPLERSLMQPIASVEFVPAERLCSEIGTVKASHIV